MITFVHTGEFKNTERFLKGAVTSNYIRILEKYGKEGVKALSANTPKDTGETAHSWSYEIRTYPGGAVIYWANSHVVDGYPIAVILQYGHGTKNGGFVHGIDYVNPAIGPLFDKIAQNVWEEVTK